MKINSISFIYVCSAAALLVWLYTVVYIRRFWTEVIPINDYPIEFDEYIQNQKTKKINIQILLQQSPVDMSLQADRLRAIDIGWGAWNHVNALHKTHIFAAVDESLIKMQKELRNVQLLHVQTIGPMARLVDAIIELSTSTVPLDWLVYANDHTFIITPNLGCFLAGYDHTDIIYTGNKLGIKKQGSLLMFASGGAGAVVSRTALQCILLSWALTFEHSKLQKSLNFFECKSSPSLENCLSSIHRTFNNSSEIADFSLLGSTVINSLYRVIDIIQKKMEAKISIVLSHRVSIDLYFFPITYYLLIYKKEGVVQSGTDRPNNKLINVSRDEFIRNCADSSAWGLENPGDYCL